MSNLSELREVVDLPPHYRVKMPAKERRAILKNALLELNLRDKMFASAGIIKIKMPPKTREKTVDNWGCNRARVVRCIRNFGPITAPSVSEILKLSMARTHTEIHALLVRDYVCKMFKEKKPNGRFMSTYIVTEAGKAYGAKK